MPNELSLSAYLLWAMSMLAAAASDDVKIAVYWGQDASEGSLRDTCSTGLYAYVNIGFLSTFGDGRAPILDLADHCDPPSGGCASLATDVASCQSAGIKLLLSIGGGTLGGYNLSSPSDAQRVAAYLWDNFLGGNGTGTGAPRPLGDAVLDGIDFHIEAPSRYYDDLARHLTSLYRGDARGRKYMLTAAPPCSFQDASLAVALGTGLFDHVWVQFYNNPPCQYAHGDVGVLLGAWQQWTTSLPSATVFLGLPASPEPDAADGGFVDADTLASQVLPAVEDAPNYGGIMLWSRSYDKDTGFSVKLQGILQNRASDKKRRNYTIIVGAAVVGVLLLFLLIRVCFLCHKKYRGTPPPEEPPQSKQKPQLLELERYTDSEIERMTKSYAQKLGHGSNGDVYHGSLHDGRQVAVKVLKNSMGDDKEFMSEVASIGRISHVNVVPLLGVCSHGPTRALIYEYMPNGSLESYVFSKADSVEENHSLRLYWEKLFDIAIGVARGLEYLHYTGNDNVVHLNVKARNILLDQELRPKISDVGVANLCSGREGKRTGDPRGRDGYDAPEVVSGKFGSVSSKSDVYSYGVMVLKMVRAKRSISVGADTTIKYFAQWIYEHLDQFCDSISGLGSETRDLIRRMIIVGLWCIQTAHKSRPSMSEVVEMLESSSMELELPVRISLSVRTYQVPNRQGSKRSAAASPTDLDEDGKVSIYDSEYD